MTAKTTAQSSYDCAVVLLLSKPVLASAFSLFYNFQAVLSDAAEQKQHAHTCCLCFSQGCPKLRLCTDVRSNLRNAFHLDHKCHRTPVSCLLRLLQLMQVLHTPFGGSIREIADAIHFQCAAFDFQKIFLAVLLHVKVNAGLSIGVL